jgi:hypothetical protein
MRLQFLLIVLFNFFISVNVQAQVNITATAGTLGPTAYTTLQSAFAAVNAGTHKGVINIAINGNITETATATLNASGGASLYTSLMIAPTGDVASTITGNNTGAVVEFNGANNVTINGLNTGGNSLTISNIGIGGVSSTIKFYGDASNNLITNCTILGASTNATTAVATGTINIATVGAAGNDNISITNCNVADASSGLPIYGIVSNGGSSTIFNDNIIIQNCNVYNFFSAAADHAGVLINNGGTGLSITGNSFYQTISRNITGSSIEENCIKLNAPNNLTGSLISNNYFGGTASACGGSAYTLTGAGVLRILSLSAGNAPINSIQNNTFKNIDFSSNSASTSHGVIGILNGAYNVGTVTANTIGDATATGTIVVSLTSAAAQFNAINLWTGTTNKAASDISNNIIGGISFAGAGVFRAINVQGTNYPTVALKNNKIGSATTAASITSSANTVMSIINFGGSASSSSNEITTNSMYNITNTATGSAAQIIGINAAYTNATAIFIAYNNINSISSTAANIGFNNLSSIVGIVFNSNSSLSTVYGNTLYNFNNTNAGLGTYNLAGIYATAASNSNINNNIIHSFSTLAGVNAQLLGIQISGGNGWKVQNNMLRLGVDAAGASVVGDYVIKGIDVPSGSVAINYNSIYIGGASSTTANNSFCIDGTSSSITSIKNNIVYNNRTAAVASKHICINYLNSIGAGNITNNLFFYNATGGAFAKSDVGGIYTSFSVMLAGGYHVGSVYSNPQFINATGIASAVNLHINTAVASEVESNGVAITGIVTDIDGNNRCNNMGCPGAAAKPDIGADEGIFLPIDVTAPVVYNFTAIPLQATITAPTLTLTIVDNETVKNIAGFKPRLYYKKCTDPNVINTNDNTTVGWKYVEAAASSVAPSFNFPIDYTKIMGAVAEGNFINYFIVAQDVSNNVGIGGTSVVTFATTPADINITTANLPATVTSNYMVAISTKTIFTAGVGGDFPSFTGDCGCFNAMNTSFNSITLGITVNVLSDITENNKYQLRRSGQIPLTGATAPSVTIYPATASVKTISGVEGAINPSTVLTGALFGLTAQSNLNIDGRVNGTGTGKYLLFRNANVNPLHTYPVFKAFSEDGSTQARLNITEVIIESNATDLLTSAVHVYNNYGFGLTFLNINNCLLRGSSAGNIGNAASAIIVNGPNSSITAANISTNSFQNFTSGSATNAVINIAACINPVVNANSIYASSVISSAIWNGILMPTKVFNGAQGAETFTITNNIIGGANATNTGLMTHTGTGAFTGINYTNSTNGHTMNISNNTVINIISNAADNVTGFTGILANTGTSIGTVNANTVTRITTNTNNTGVFYGISSRSGVANFTNNTIGSLVTTLAIRHNTKGAIAGIYINSNTNTTAFDITGNTISNFNSKSEVSSPFGFVGIFSNAAAAAVVNIQNNIVKSINVNPPVYTFPLPPAASSAFGMYLQGGSYNVGTTTGNTIDGIVNSGDTTTGAGLVANTSGIYAINNGVGNISNNTVKNLTAFGKGNAVSLRGIWNASTANFYLNNNKVSTLISNSASTNNNITGAALCGIESTSAAGQEINYNTINDLSSSSTAANNFVIGININGKVAGFIGGVNSHVSHNKIYDIRNTTSTSNTSRVVGINMFAGGTSVATIMNITNNMVSINNANSTKNVLIIGIRDINEYSNSILDYNAYYYNTVHIYGVADATNSNSSYAYSRDTRPSYNIFKNNIFQNIRTGGIGKHFAIGNLVGSPSAPTTAWATSTSDYNNLYSANANTIGEWGVNQAKNFTNWKSTQPASSGGDANSVSVQAFFIDPANGDLHLDPLLNCNILNKGIGMTFPLNDFDGDVRRTGTNPAGPDLGADEINKTTIWTGNVSTNWGLPSNWNNGIVPNTFYSNVVIPVVANKPIIETGDNFQVANITVQANSLLTIKGTLKVSGVIASTNCIDNQSGMLELNTDGSICSKIQTISGTMFVNKAINDLLLCNTVNVSATLNDTLKILSNLAFGNVNNKTFTTNDNLTLVSNENATANLNDITNAGANSGNSINGKAIIERYLFAQKAWRFLATPVGTGSSPSITSAWRETGSTISTGYGTQITGPATSIGMDQTSQRGSLKYYNAANDVWTEVTNTNDLLANNLGYMVFVRGDRSVNQFGLGATNLRIKGDILMGNQVFAVPAGKFQSFGNPYPSRINFSSVLKTNVVDAFTIWNPRAVGLYNVGGYENYSLAAGDYWLNGVVGGTKRNFIESGEAVFVQSNGAAGSITVREIDKALLSTNVSRGYNAAKSAITIPTLDISLYTKDAQNNATLLDAVSLNFDDSYSEAIDNNDVRKLINPINNLSIKTKNKLLVVEKRPAIVATDSIQLNLAGTAVANYEFEIYPTLMNMASVEAYVVDRFLQTTTAIDLSQITNLHFAVTTDAASKAVNRFIIVFKQSATTSFTTISAKRNIDKTITVNWGISNEKNINNYIVEQSNDGIHFTTLSTQNTLVNNGTNQLYNTIDATASKENNWYRVKMNNTNGSLKYSSIAMVAAVKDDAINQAPSIAIYPNPVVNGKVNLYFKNKETGKYYLVIYNSAGQKISTKEIIIEYNYVHSLVHLGSPISGQYEAIITNEKGEKSTIPFLVK